MLTSGQTTTPLQIFWELFLYSKVIFKSMKVADDTFKRNSECEWVNSFISGTSKRSDTWIYPNPSNAEATFVQGTRMQRFWKPSKHCHVGIHLKALAESSQMSTHISGFRLYFKFLASFCIGQISQWQHKGLITERSFENFFTVSPYYLKV